VHHKSQDKSGSGVQAAVEMPWIAAGDPELGLNA